MISLQRTGLAEILTPGWQWTWSVTAVLSVEVLAGEPVDSATARRRPGRWKRLLDAATDRAVDQLAAEPRPLAIPKNGRANGQARPERSRRARPPEAAGTVQTIPFEAKRDE